ncbi:MAG: hypothetical protein K6F57_03700 [Candidatus Saccharibacteria bacterium]|nr:hypothetical protein [Candidatus Saccharibacteria bacterium]
MKNYAITNKRRIDIGDDLTNVASTTLLFEGSTMKTDHEMQDFMVSAKRWCTDENFNLKPIITPVLGITDYDLAIGIPDGTFHHGITITCKRIDCEYIGNLTPPQDETNPNLLVLARFDYETGISEAWRGSIMTFIANAMEYFGVPETYVYITDPVRKIEAVKISITP